MTATTRKAPNRMATRKAPNPVLESHIRVRSASLNLTTYPPEAAIASYQAVQAAADEAIRAVVEQMRWDGSSWADIGEALGVSTQAAHKRFAGITGG